jgi:hypothetical protein
MRRKSTYGMHLKGSERYLERPGNVIGVQHCLYRAYVDNFGPCECHLYCTLPALAGLTLSFGCSLVGIVLAIPVIKVLPEASPELFCASRVPQIEARSGPARLRHGSIGSAGPDHQMSRKVGRDAMVRNWNSTRTRPTLRLPGLVLVVADVESH